ncbi:MAG TPA: hypothetical protein VNM92_03450 [Thermoanaerobaculia bacterium]|nr:hypothetical protein [Thermoanaerobaculia bacterium]
MSDSLAVYLHDHLAGAVAGVNLLEALSEQHTGEPLGLFAAALLEEVEEDRAALQAIADRVGAGSSGVKNAAAWVTEKISRLKLSRDSAADFGTFETLEALSLGIMGKRSLWRALATQSTRLGDVNLQSLEARADAQFNRVEEQRMKLAGQALRFSKA